MGATQIQEHTSTDFSDKSRLRCKKFVCGMQEVFGEQEADVVKANLEGDANEMDFGGKDDEYKSSQSQQ